LQLHTVESSTLEELSLFLLTSLGHCVALLAKSAAEKFFSFPLLLGCFFPVPEQQAAAC
jgi:hypothetical protein